MLDKHLAVEIAVQTIILLIGLSASFITFTATFAQSKKIRIGAWEKWAWVFMGISIITGILTLLKLIGNIDSGNIKSLVFETWTRGFAISQIFTFVMGLLFIVIMAIKK